MKSKLSIKTVLALQTNPPPCLFVIPTDAYLEMDIGALASLYTCPVTATQLVPGGRVHANEKAASLMSRVFALPGGDPWESMII